jgi:hypothetical protein
LRYNRYDYRSEYDGKPRTYRGYAIIAQPCGGGGGIGLLMRQRNGGKESPYRFDLPGGERSELDDSLAETAARETLLQVSLGGDPETAVAVGGPLWLPTFNEGGIDTIDCVQAFLLDVGAECPETSDEALNIAVVNEYSAMGLSIVGFTHDNEKKEFGRTPIMLWDGLSVIGKPFYDKPESISVTERLGVHLSTDMYLPVDDGNYLARKRGRNIELFYRLNPFEQDGRFVGNLEDLAQV